MFGKKLRIRIEELENEIALNIRLNELLQSDKEQLVAEINRMKGVDCEHEYQLVCAVTLVNMTLAETGGLYEKSFSCDAQSVTYYHPVDNYENGAELVAIYARRCRHCGQLISANCFDVAAVHQSAWIESPGPSPFEGIRYMVNEKIHAIKKTTKNKLDVLLDKIENG